MIRRARPTDAAPLAALQVRSWWAAYGAFVDHEKIADAATRVPDAWAERLGVGTPFDGPASREEVWVVEHDGAVSAFVSIGPSRDPDARAGDGEIRAIYVDPPWFGRGDGHALLVHAEERLAALGFPDATLWVMSENAGARSFYARHAWEPDPVPGENPYGGWGDATRYRKHLAPTPAPAPPSPARPG